GHEVFGGGHVREIDPRGLEAVHEHLALTRSVHRAERLVFDSSVERGEPITFPLNGVIAGWTEGLQLMSEGSKYILYIPSDLGYGDRGTQGIKPGATLIFEVELLEVIVPKVSNPK
ncbi:MAG: FKBP-type peptidyl-prolyl cis-trans isomerase, partial [Bacteroidales bacterium]|nr:FKBP-type peptidyl-prolyl cis-trans isomerase [Bacteroidales bacterium]